MHGTNRHGARKIARVATSALLGLLTVFAVLVLLVGIFARPGKDHISRLDGHPILTVLSGSMVPVFNPGDLVIDDPVDASQAARLVPGDIITFHVNGGSTNLITHRIVAVRHPHAAPGDPSGVLYQTKGVANNAPDPELVAPSQVVGTYTRHVRYAGYLLEGIQKKTVFFLIIFLPLLYLIGSEIAKRWREPEEVSSQAPETTPETTSDGASAFSPEDPRHPELAYAASLLSDVSDANPPRGEIASGEGGVRT